MLVSKVVIVSKKIIFLVLLIFFVSGCSHKSTSCNEQQDQKEVSFISRVEFYPADMQFADVWADGDYAYLGTFIGSGVFIIDMTTPNKPVIAAHYQADSAVTFKDAKAKNGIGYFSSDAGEGVHIVDVSVPSRPELITRITSQQGGYDSVQNIFESEGFLYLVSAGQSTVIKVFDVREPATPVFVMDIEATDSSHVHDVTVLNGKLYSAGQGGTTDIFDVQTIADGQAPLLGSFDSGEKTHSNWVTKDGNYLVSTREVENGDVRIFNIANPQAVERVATISAASLGIEGSSPHNLAIFQDTLFVAWYDKGLQVIDLKDPTNPKSVGIYDTFRDDCLLTEPFRGNWGVYPFLGFDKILLSDTQNGLVVVDVNAVVN